MNKKELFDYVERVKNLSSLKRVVRSKNPILYQEILDSWNYADPPANFVEIVRQYFDPENIYCQYGRRKKFNGYNHLYSCNRKCPCVREKFERTMNDRYGVSNALQNKKIFKSFTETLKQRYDATNLNQAFSEKRKQTNLLKYGAETPLESQQIREKCNNTYYKNSGFKTPFSKFNHKENQQFYIDLKRDKQIEKFENEYDQDKIKETLSNYSYYKSSEILGLTPTRLKVIAIRNGWDDLLPKKSSYENLISRFLNENSIVYKQNTRSIISPYELDFYIPEHNLAIEFHGLCRHGEDFSKKDKTYHRMKMDLCRERDIHLIQIFEDEFNNHQDTIFSIIKSFCKIDKNRIFARKCNIIQIGTKEARNFCERYHLQGYSSSSVRYGVYYGLDLVAVVTYKKRKAEVYELSRYCVLPDVSLVGVLARVQKRFKSEHSFKHLFTYSDNRYFKGDVYKKIGFSYERDTVINYWYFRNSDRRYHRLSFTKQRLVKKGYDSSMTEWQIMKSLGYDRIWDCGNKKWIMEKDI